MVTFCTKLIATPTLSVNVNIVFKQICRRVFCYLQNDNTLNRKSVRYFFITMSNRDLLSEQGLRIDGRRPKELRGIRCKLGVFSQPDGSAYLEQGNTKVLAAVYGPHQCTSKIKGSSESVIVNCQYSMATFSTGERKNRPRGDKKSQEMSLHLKQALSAAIKTELYPYSQIDVYVEILQADGGNFAACVNASTLALVDAGVPLRELLCGSTAGLAPGEVPLVDVSHLEESLGGANLNVAMLPTSGNIALLSMSQRFHVDHLEKVLETALQGCRDTQAILDRAIRQHLTEMGSSVGWGQVPHLPNE